MSAVASLPEGGYNFAYLDEGTKRMIRRAILKAIAIPGYQVPFASREMPMPYGWGTGGVQVTAAVLGASDVLKVIAETDPEACVKFDVMSQIDRFGWEMENTAGVQSTISLPWAAKQVNTAFSEASPKFKLLPRNQFTMVQAITPIPTSSGLPSPNCHAMAVFVFTGGSHAGAPGYRERIAALAPDVVFDAMPDLIHLVRQHMEGPDRHRSPRAG